jgi:hypothetical protein
MKQYILKIDASFSQDQLTSDDLFIFNILKIQWVGQLIGTKAYYGKQLILCLIDADKETVEQVIKNGLKRTLDDGTEETVNLSFNVKVMAVEDEKIDQALLLDYFLPEEVYNSETGEFDSVEIDDLTNRIQTYAGRSWIY